MAAGGSSKRAAPAARPTRMKPASSNAQEAAHLKMLLIRDGDPRNEAKSKMWLAGQRKGINHQ